MTPETVIEIGQQALLMIIMLTAPMLLTALAIGLVISMIQAATSIQEMTLTFIPKLLGIFIVLILAGDWMLGILVDYVNRLYESIPGLIG